MRQICLTLFVLLFLPLAAAANPIHVGIPMRAAMSNDAQPLINILNKVYGILLKEKINLDIEFVGVNSVEELYAKMNSRDIDAAAFWTELEYLYIKRRLTVVPLVTSAYTLQNGPDIQKVLVVRLADKINNLADIKGKIFAYHQRVGLKPLTAPLERSDMHLLALKLALTEQGLAWNDFFSPQSFSIAENLNPQAKSSVILSILHGQADFTIVNDLDFKLTAKNVPRVAAELTALPLPKPIKLAFPPLFCRANLDEKIKTGVSDVMTHAHEHILGQAALSIIPVDYFVKVTNNDYQETKSYEERLINQKILTP